LCSRLVARVLLNRTAPRRCRLRQVVTRGVRARDLKLLKSLMETRQ
jgi:hypothetical protein